MQRLASYKSLTWPLIAGMGLVAIIAAGTSITLLYRAAYDQALEEMQQSASTLAGIMEAVAQFDIRFSARAHPQGSWGATMSQIEQGLRNLPSAHDTGELVIARHVGDNIEITSRTERTPEVADQLTIPINDTRAEPARRALRGERGYGELPDHRGEPVLAGYAPVPSLAIGVVYKIDLAEMRAPYIRAAMWASLAVLILIAVGSAGFVAFIRPAQQRAEASDQRLRFLLNASPVGVYEADTTGHYTYTNEQWSVLTGLLPGEALVEGWQRALHPDDRQRVAQAWHEFVKSHTHFRMEYRLRRPDGSVCWVFGQAAPLVDLSGEVSGYSGTVTDISERKSSEVAVSLVLNRLNEAQRLAKVGSWELDLVDNSLNWSDEIFRMFEVDKNKFGASYEAFLNAIHPDDRDRVNQAYARSLETREKYEIVHRLLMRDGCIKHVRETCETFFDNDGKPLRSVGTVQDITELHRAEMELRKYREHLEELVNERTAALEAARTEAERASKAKSEFLSRMSHELRTPMNAILGFAQVLGMDKLSEEQLGYAREIKNAGAHLLDLINELLDLSRIEAGKLATVIETVDVSDAVRDAVQIAHGTMAQYRVSLHDRCKETGAQVLADTTRLKQILVNLLTNAAKYNREGGSILLSCERRDGGTLRISVTDAGIGIPPEKLNNLFKPFERLGAEFGAIEGTGIGLALSKQLAGLMGGTLGVDSTPGEGSTFWVELPCAVHSRESQAKVAPTMPDATQANARKKVLYVEDNQANYRVVEAMFRHQPHLQLLSATNGEYGLELARRYHPDVILLDIHLPGMDGYMVFDELKRDPTTKAIPVIALSADAMPIDIERGLKAGFVHYLTKPVKVEELMGAVNTLLRQTTGMRN